jgi:hypothetical protein
MDRPATSIGAKAFVMGISLMSRLDVAERMEERKSRLLPAGQ